MRLFILRLRNMEKCVAIIMPAYNCRDTLSRAVESVINQTYKNWHLYIINDASPEPLDDILSFYENKHENITVINNSENQGAAGSRNIGLRHSDEEVIAFLDSDDFWHPTKLQKQIAILGDSGGVITSYFFISEENEKKSIKISGVFLFLNDLLKKKYKICFSSLIHYRIPGLYFEKIGHEDFLYIYNLFKRFDRLSILDEYLVDCYYLTTSLSANKKKAACWHFNVLKKIFPGRYDKIIYYFIFYAINGFLFRIRNK